MPCANNWQIKCLAAIMLSCGFLVTFVMAGQANSRVSHSANYFPSKDSQDNKNYGNYNSTETHENDTQEGESDENNSDETDSHQTDSHQIDTQQADPQQTEIHMVDLVEIDYNTVYRSEELQNDLRCSYMISIINHLLFSLGLLMSSVSLKTTVKTILMYEDTAQKQLSILYGLNATQKSSMWASYLYIKLLTLPKPPYSDKEVLLREHRYIHRKLHKDYHNNCFKHYRMAMANPMFGSEFNLLNNSHRDELLDITMKHASDFLTSINRLIRLNYENGLRYSSYHSMSLDALLLNGFGFNQIIDNIMAEYYLIIDWRDFSAVAEKSFKKVHVFDIDTYNLSCLQEYQEMCINFLKLIMMRFSEMHFDYVIVLSKQHELILARSFLDSWCEILTEFAKFLHLRMSDDIIWLKKNFQKIGIVVSDPEQSDFKSEIHSKVTKLARSLDVNAEETFDFTDSKNKRLNTIMGLIKDKTIEPAKNFVHRIKTFFKYAHVDFGIINMIIEL